MTESNTHIDTDPKAEAQNEERMRKQWALEAAGKLIKTRQYFQSQKPTPSRDKAMQACDRAIETMHAVIRGDYD